MGRRNWRGSGEERYYVEEVVGLFAYAQGSNSTVGNVSLGEAVESAVPNWGLPNRSLTSIFSGLREAYLDEPPPVVDGSNES